jgi:hypothetical protein
LQKRFLAMPHALFLAVGGACAFTKSVSDKRDEARYRPEFRGAALGDFFIHRDMCLAQSLRYVETRFTTTGENHATQRFFKVHFKNIFASISRSFYGQGARRTENACRGSQESKKDV